jgi:hypothetical protein
MPQHEAATLDAADQAAIAAHGLTVSEIERQAALLRGPQSFRRLDRTASPGDGVIQLTEAQVTDCLETFAEAAAHGRFLSFVPASGAASRMFKSLVATLAAGGDLSRATLRASSDPDAQDTLRVCDERDSFAFADELRRYFTSRGDNLDSIADDDDCAPLLHALLDDDALASPERAKGLLGFHLYRDTTRTAFEEHLEEAASLLRADDGRVALHFTVSPQHEEAFAATLARARGPIEKRHVATLDIAFSTQSPATDTIALDDTGALFRDDGGRLLFRPGGHGSLIHNLEGTGGDLVFIKNIDNIVPDDRREPVLRWRRTLGGLLVHLLNRTAELAARLQANPDDADAAGEARVFLANDLGLVDDTEGDLRRALERVLGRPMRVCGVVRNTGDPGGGPFWVQRNGETVSRQIVETAEIDTTDATQAALLGSATHFNPTDMVCALRGQDGQAFDLDSFVDRDAVFMAEKSHGGRALRALEHPGLWNGSMADWTTVFVEAPREIFQPVKTVLDLLGPGHRPAA